MKTVSLETMIDNHIGKIGTDHRNSFEQELKGVDIFIASEPLTDKARKEISEFIRNYKSPASKKNKKPKKGINKP